MAHPDLLCAICRTRTGPDGDHVEIDAEMIRLDDRTDTEKYVLCPDCWMSVSGGWGEPV